METWMLIVAAAGGAVFALVVMVLLVRRRRALLEREEVVKDELGAEYERARDEQGRRRAVDRLEPQVERLEAIAVQKISPADRDAFTERWEALKLRFVDAPAEAIRLADELVTTVMRDRNLPVGSIEDRVRSLAYLDDDGTTAVDFRDAHALFVELESDDAEDRVAADFREALLAYQTAFEVVIDRPKSDRDKRVDRTPTEPVRRG